MTPSRWTAPSDADGAGGKILERGLKVKEYELRKKNFSETGMKWWLHSYG